MTSEIIKTIFNELTNLIKNSVLHIDRTVNTNGHSLTIRIDYTYPQPITKPDTKTKPKKPSSKQSDCDCFYNNQPCHCGNKSKFGPMGGTDPWSLQPGDGFSQ